MYLNFWQPMALSAEVADAPIQVKALGQYFALFRTRAGNVSCLADVCIHRGGSLSTGKQLDDCLQCPYHGWQFDASGRCVRIPTLPPDGKIPARARVDNYPVVERYGVIFAFLGDAPEDERPPILEIKEWGLDGWSIPSLVYPWQANVERVIENGLDATHTEFVHPSAGMQGSFSPAELEASRLVKHEWGNEYLTETSRVVISHGHHGVNHQWTHLDVDMGQRRGHFNFYSFVRPMDEHSVMRYLFIGRDFQTSEEQDRKISEMTLGFEKEDRPVIEGMRPVQSPLGSNGELLMPEDEIMLAYRKNLAEWRSKGWRIDSNAVLADPRETFSIPSPARREGGNWVRETVPVFTQ
jgi:phenylpropionate dioxygenase-like ring-hydroxylating dioxygenase large terminal subunit